MDGDTSNFAVATNWFGSKTPGFLACTYVFRVTYDFPAAVEEGGEGVLASASIMILCECW
jgi:hypothetical protein